jgi:hypothetical protein
MWRWLLIASNSMTEKDIKRNYLDSALGTALYILKSIDEGQSKKEIIQSLDNNEQLVLVWIQYLKTLSWLEEDTRGNLRVSADGKSRIQQYEMALSLKLQDTSNIMGRQYELDKCQQEMINFYHSAFTKFMEITLMDYWNYLWLQTLPITNMITETYAAALNRLINESKTASKAVNEAIFANIEVFSTAILEK